MRNIQVKIGKYAIENLTIGMYKEPCMIYREYIQNAVDQIDKAVQEGLLKNITAEAIVIDIDPKSRTVTIEDRATGVKVDDVITSLIDVADSNKNKNANRGFRGIGRLGGLAYCEKLKFVTSYKGEPSESTVIWNAKQLRESLNSSVKLEAGELIEQSIQIDSQKAKADAHYFKVCMEGVHWDGLLDIETVKNYLSMVAPVPIASNFLFHSRIEKIYADEKVRIDEYNIQVNGEQLFKPYTSSIKKDEKQKDSVVNFNPITIKDNNGKLLAIGWHSIGKRNESIPACNLARGIRLRKGNIQIGDSFTLRKWFSRENGRFHFYFFGEIHVFGEGLVPNSQRDYFEADDAGCLAHFENKLEDYFNNTLYRLVYRCQAANKYESDIAKLQELEATNERNLKERLYTSHEERDSFRESIETQKKNLKKSEADMIKGLDSEPDIVQKTIKTRIDGFVPIKIKETPVGVDCSSKQKKMFRADRLSHLDRKQRKLMEKVYKVIKKILTPDEADLLIDEIEKELGYSNESA